MTEQEWLTRQDPAVMMRWLIEGWFPKEWREPWRRPTNRQLRLFSCGCCLLAGRDVETVDEYERRGYFDEDESRDGYTDEQWARNWCNKDPNGRELVPLSVRASLLRDIFGNPWKPYCDLSSLPASMRPEWITPTVLRVAQTIYEERSFQEMTALADVMEEAGCQEKGILEHCRPLSNPKAYIMDNPVTQRLENHPPGPHVRGCHILDLILGKK